MGRLKGAGNVYLQAAADAYGSYAFACLHTGKLPEPRGRGGGAP